MASRVCPKCNAQVPVGEVAALSDGIDCSSCHTRLEVSPPGRMIGAWLGMAAAFVAWRVTRGGPGPLGGSLPLLYAVLAFGVVSALTTIFMGDLRLAPELPPVETAPAGGHAHAGHDAHGHGGGHH